MKMRKTIISDWQDIKRSFSLETSKLDTFELFSNELNEIQKKKWNKGEMEIVFPSLSHEGTN